MEGNISILGSRLKALRKEKKLTLQSLGKKTGLTAGLLSKIENFRVLPSLPVLEEIAKALETDLASLFTPGLSPEGRKKFLHIKAKDFRKIDREENSGFTYFLAFESRLTGDRQQVMLVEIAPGAERKPVAGDGTEILYMISGRLTYFLGEEKVELKKGDLLFFDSTLPHTTINQGKTPALLLVHYHLYEPIF